MNSVAISRLELQGFGVFGRTTRFTLDEGLNVFIAPNESGKSTFLAGVLAVLFGLPEKSDAQSWGTSRFQSWDHPLPYRGEILLLTDGHWHRIHRDFAMHQVIWTVADAAGAPAALEGALVADLAARGGASTANPAPRAAASSLPQPPSPATDAWRVHFHDEHRVSGRSESRQRYDQLLRQVLGLDDLGLFRLTYCITQDPEDRTKEESVYRSRQIPQEVQHLISGSGGRVQDVLAHLFDRYGEITQATGDAGLVRPGNIRAANLHNPGRLETVTEQLNEKRKALEAAVAALDHLQGSQARSEEVRGNLETVQRQLKQDQGLLKDWKEWAETRRRQRELLTGAVEIEKAIAQLEKEENAARDSEGKLAASLPEYQDPAFPFAERAEALKALVDAERDRARVAQELEETGRRHAQLAGEIQQVEAEIRERYAQLVGRPHLLHDWDDWARVRAELTAMRGEVAAIREERERCESEIARTTRWTALDTESEPGKARPVGRLEDLRKRLPRFLEQVSENLRLRGELASCEERLAGELRVAAEVPEELRREARVHPERRELLRSLAESAARLSRELAERLERFLRAEKGLKELEAALAARLGPPAALVAGAFPEPWAGTREAVRKKLDCLKEEGRLQGRIADSQRRIRRGLFKQVILPALGAALALFAVVYVATHLPAPGSATFLVAAAAGVIAGAAVAFLTYRRAHGSSLKELRAVQGRLSAVRGTLQEVDKRLAAAGKGFEGLDQTELMEIETAASQYLASAQSIEEMRPGTPQPQDLILADHAASQAEAEFTAFEERTAVLGPDPRGLISAWESTTGRMQALKVRLETSAAELGPEDWPQRPVGSLPASWAPFAALAALVAPEEPTTDPWTAARVVSVLKTVRPEDWAPWIEDARVYERCSGRLGELRSREDFLHAPDEQGQDRLAQLEARDSALAQACAAYELTQPREEIATAVSRYEALEERRARALAQREPLGQSLAGIEDARSKLEQRIAELRGPLDACLKPAAGDPSAALTRMEKARELRGRIAMTAAACESILRARGADGGDDLRVKLEESRQNCAGATERIRALEERYALFHELADADPEELQRRYADLEERAGRMEQEAQALDHEYATMREQVADARAEGRQARNAAVLETEVQNLAHEQAALTRERGACGIAFTTLQEAAERFSQTHRERLEQRVSQIFRRISLNAERTIRLKEDFEIEILDGGRPCAIRQLSQGARDQLALALRLAVAELLSEERRLPLLFDDPFLSFDPKRLEEMRGTLAALAEERQIVLLSHRAEQAGWGHRIAIE